MKVGDKHSKGTFVESNEIDIKEIPTNSKLLLDMIEETSDWTTKSSDQNSPRNAYGYESDSNDVVISKGKEEIEISEKKIEEEKKLKPSGISIVELNKNKKNESKYFSKLVSIDKDAFGDLDGQVFILKQFWKSKTNKIIVAQKKQQHFNKWICLFYSTVRWLLLLNENCGTKCFSKKRNWETIDELYV